MAENIGMMSGAFFVSKGELLKWLNDFFGAGYKKVEEVATGAMHCQILDSIFPGKVPLHKVNFGAKFDYEYVANYKILQKVFQQQGVQKHVDVAKLIKGKYQDNLEFLQWMKNFWDVRYGGQDYDAEQRRAQAIARYNKGRKFKTSTSRKPRPAADSKVAPAKSRSRPGLSSGSSAATRKPRARPKGGKDDSSKVTELNEKLAKLRATIEGLEKERNFYFGKLREIELLCQKDEEVEAATKAAVLQILYATDDNDEFEAPVEDEEEVLDEEVDDVPADDEELTF